MFDASVEKTPTIQLPDLIDSVANGEEVVFSQNNLPIAKFNLKLACGGFRPRQCRHSTLRGETETYSLAKQSFLV